MPQAASETKTAKEQTQKRWVFKSRIDGMYQVRGTSTVDVYSGSKIIQTRRVPGIDIIFTDRTWELNEAIARQHKITCEDFLALIEACPSYGGFNNEKSGAFFMVSSPDKPIDEEGKKLVRAADEQANRVRVNVVQGAKTGEGKVDR